MIIDCIEFAERFRCGDTAAELAFLAMELESEGRADLAAGLIARFAEASDDFGLYGVLDFYLSYRAWVRGKVAAFVAVDPSTPSAISALEAGGGPPFFRPGPLVLGVAARPAVPDRGGRPIGSGKSTLAAELGRELAVPVVSSDRTRKLSAGLPLTAPADGRLYDKDERDRTYDEIIRRGRPGHPVGSRRRRGRDVLDPPLAPARRRRRARRAGVVRVPGDALPA